MDNFKLEKMEKGVYGLRIDRMVSLASFTKNARDIAVVENIPNIAFVPVVTLRGNVKIKGNFDQESVQYIPDEKNQLGIGVLTYRP